MLGTGAAGVVDGLPKVNPPNGLAAAGAGAGAGAGAAGAGAEDEDEAPKEKPVEAG